MKKFFRSALTLLFAALLLCSLGVSAFADSAVTYGQDRVMYVSPDKDIFDAFKNVMPGDSITETITIRNECTRSPMVLIYLQAVPHDPTVGPHVISEDYSRMMEFLSQLTLTVSQNGKVISQDTADKPAGLASRQLVGMFYGKGQSVVQVTITVPKTMGNEFADRIGEVDWMFTAEEWGDPVNLKTGDDSNTLFWVGLILLSMTALAWVLIILGRKKKTD